MSSQINIHVTANFETALKRLMRIRHIPTKSEAIRFAVGEALAQAGREQKSVDFTEWLGLAKRAPLNKSPRFRTHDALWE